MFHWKPEGHYHHTLRTAIAPFSFSMEHWDRPDVTRLGRILWRWSILPTLVAVWRGRRWAITLWGLFSLEMSQYWQYHRLRTKRMLMLFNNVPLKTRRALSPYTSYSNSALLVLNGALRQIWCNEAWLHFVTVINFANTGCSVEGRRLAITLWRLFSLEMLQYWQYHRLKTKRMLMLFNDVPLRTRRALSPYTSYSNSALLVLNGALR